MEENKIDILDIAIILAKHKKFIITTTLIVSIFAVTYSLLTTQYWTSSAIIKPVSGMGGSGLSLGSLNSSMLSSISSSFGISGNEDGIKQVAVMESRTFLEKIINEFDLYEVFEIDDEDVLKRRDNALKELRRKVLSIEYSMEKALIYIQVETKDKYLSAKIANFIHEELDYYNKNERKIKATESRIFLENRINQIEAEIDNLLIQVANFQKENNFLEASEQINSVITSYSSLVASKMEKDIEYEFLSSYSNTDSKKLIALKKQIDAFAKRIKDFETTSENSSLPSYLVSLDEIPDLATKYAKIKMDLKIKSDLFEFLIPQLEYTRLEEMRESTTLEIIDYAVPAGLRTWPRRALLCIALFLVSVISTSLISISIEFSHRFVDKEKYKVFKETLFNKSK